MKLLLVVIGLSCFTSVFAQNEENAEAEATEKALPNPPNKWGTYYALPNDFSGMRDAFTYLFETKSVGSPKDFSECSLSATNFERWYINSDDGSVIFSYFCFGSETRGYEHIQARYSQGDDKSSAAFLAWKEKLSDFGITDAGPYKKANTVDGKSAGDKAGKEQSRLLEAVKEQIVAQLKDGNQICINPSTKTVYQYTPKKENGLYYTKFPVSCDDSGGVATYMMEVEVVEDKDFKQVNGGEPKLVAAKDPQRNIIFIQDTLAEKQSSGAETLKSFVSLALLSVVYRLF